jgi:hypothetical protein
MNTHAQPTPMSIFKRLGWFNLEIYEVDHQECFIIDGDIVYHSKNN